MEAYLLVFGLLFLFSFSSFCLKKTSFGVLLPLCLCFFLAVLFCSVKNDLIGPDTIEYHKYFNSVQNASFTNLFSLRMEIGFTFFTKFVSIFSKSFTFYNFVFYFIVWGGFALFSFAFSEAPSACFSLIFIFSLQFALTAYRQTLAVSMIAIAMALFKICKKKFTSCILFAVFFILGLSFHFSTIACGVIPVCYLLTKKYKINPYLCCGFFVAFVFGSRCIYYLIADFTSTAYAPFIRNSLPSTSLMAFFVFLLGYFFNCSPFFQIKNENVCFDGVENMQRIKPRCSVSPVGSFLKNQLSKRTTGEDLFLNTGILLSLVASCVMSFSLITTIITRIYVFFEAPLSMVIINTISNRSKRGTRIFGFLSVAVLAVLYFYVSLLRSGYASFYLPYETIF